MSTLWLVRHGQASVHREDYDQLSDLGIEQSKKLGEHLATRGLSFDAVYMGPRKRHQETYQHTRDAAAAQGLTLPEVAVLDGMDEVDTSQMGVEAMARVLPSCPDLKAQLTARSLNVAGKKAMHHYVGIYEKLMQRWSAGEGLADESFDTFSGRVVNAIQAVMREQGKGKQCLIFTSGGPICVSIRLALKLDPARAIELMFVTQNASMTRLQFRPGKLTMSAFNDVGYLPEEMLTGI